MNLEKSQRRSSSRVRDHLANERTYLAWMRTAISLLGFGVVIVRLRFFKPPVTSTPGNGWKLGLIFSLVGLTTVILSTYHYFAIRQDIDEDVYEPPDRWVLIFSLTITLLGAGVIFYVFTLPLNPINTMMFE
ncbi:MAG: YidH family protein [Xenococcaceae cyanobacterium]